MNFRKLFSFSALVIFTSVAAQQEDIDSLLKILSSAHNDSLRSYLLVSIGDDYDGVDQSKALDYAFRGMEIADSIGNDYLRAFSRKTLGNIYTSIPDEANALKYSREGLKIAKSNNDHFNEAALLNNLGNIYSADGDVREAMQLFSEALPICVNYHYDHYRANVLSNLSDMYLNLHMVDSSLYFMNIADSLFIRLGDYSGVGNSLNNLALFYMDSGKYYLSEKYLRQSLQYAIDDEDKESMALVNNNLGDLFSRQQQYDNAKKYYLEGLKNAQEAGIFDLWSDALSGLALIYSKTGDYKNAFRCKVSADSLNDSISTASAKRGIADLKSGFDREQKENELKLDQQQLHISKLENEQTNAQKKILRNVLIASGIVAVLFIVILFNRYKIKQKANEQLTIKNELIEMKQKEIIDSINYAKRIQQSLLPAEKYISKKLNPAQAKRSDGEK
ncbi:MAG: tetratricopeptide repeat protein [Bacteroidetes bacterium]|nr:tetratricopeptide repeat protein [Bacteroidota bacterium]